MAQAAREGSLLKRLAVIVLLLPFWATSEIRQANWSRNGKIAAIATVWVLTIALAAGAAQAPQRQAPPESTVEPPRSTTPVSVAAPTADTFEDVPIGWPRPPLSTREAFVASVTDGDTIVLSGIDVGEIQAATGGRKSRLIGIDTPEVFGRADCYGAQASAFTKRELDGKEVLVDFDVEKTDRYGRALVYVWQTDGRFFNARLASEGFALQLTIAPNVRYADLFTELVRDAREHDRGLWRGCAAPVGGGPQVPAPQPERDRDCPDFSTQPEAQRFFESQGGPSQDPHRLDADHDGIACEELPGAQAPNPPPTATASGVGNCHPSYPDFCIPPPPPDLDCGDVSRKDFRVLQNVSDPDPHGFDADNDGVGCES